MPELEHIVEKISGLLQYVFEPKSLIYFKWEKSSYAVFDNRYKELRLDFVLFNDNQEIDCGKIKNDGTADKLLGEDRARIAETMKRQLYKRVITSRGHNEFKAFGIFFNGVQLELYIMSFNPQADISNGKYYHLYQVDDLKVLCFCNSYNNLEETLEFLKAFKSVIVSSLPANPANTPLLEHNYADLFQSTLRFTKT